MDKIQKIREWIRENVPTLLVLFENKYVGMAYDRFASLPSKQQRQLFQGAIGGAFGAVFLYLLVAYWGLWSTTAKTREYQRMIDALLEHQRAKQDQSEQIKNLDRNGQIAASGELKRFLQDQARGASISNKLVEVEEKGERAAPESGQKGIGEAKVKEAKVILNRITLAQLKTFLVAVEHGQYNLRIATLKLVNDDKLRGYLRAEVLVSAFLFNSEEAGG